MADNGSTPIDPERLAEALRAFNEVVEACTSPVHYAVPVAEEQFLADKRKRLEQMINGF